MAGRAMAVASGSSLRTWLPSPDFLTAFMTPSKKTPNTTIRKAPAKAMEGVDAVDRALKLLAVFTKDDRALTLSELSARADLHVSTALRLLASLQKAGLIHRYPDKTFAIGAGVMHLSALYRNAFRLEEYVRPQLQQLVQVTQESASFFRAEGNQRICLVREHSNRVVRDHAFEGDLLPMNGSPGRVLTVFRDCQSGNIPRQLLAMLPVVSLGEADREIAGIAVPVFDSKGLAGALAISGPIYRFTDPVIRRFKSLILETGQELSVALGGTVYIETQGRPL